MIPGQVRTVWLALFFLFYDVLLQAQSKPESPAKPFERAANQSPQKSESPKLIADNSSDEKSVASITNISFKAVGPGLFELGKIRIDKRQRTVSFPATVNRDQGPMEYFLVTGYGKTHESILRTETKPYEIHLAMLLLGATGSGTNAPFESSPEQLRGQISNPSREALPGDKVTIEVKWMVNGKEVMRAAPDLIFNKESHSTAKEAKWVYNGSLIARGKFLAQIEGSIVSLVTDPIALVNNIGSGHDNDRIWGANTNDLPPVETSLEVTFQLH